MTKAEIITEISTKTGIEKVDVQETVEAFFKVVKSSMVGGENVYVRGFGSFVVKKRAKKTGSQNNRKRIYDCPPQNIFYRKKYCQNRDWYRQG